MRWEVRTVCRVEAWRGELGSHRAQHALGREYDDVFDLDDFLASCDEARAEPETRRAITELLRRTMADHTQVASVLDATPPGLTMLLEAPDLTVVHAVWARMSLPPHGHQMWAVIGIYGGQEDNTLYRRAMIRQRSRFSGGRSSAGDVFVLGDDAIHSVTNLVPGSREPSVYGGDSSTSLGANAGPRTSERPSTSTTCVACSSRWTIRNLGGFVALLIVAGVCPRAGGTARRCRGLSTGATPPPS